MSRFKPALLITFILLLSAAKLSAQPRFAYDLDFSTHFDNGEYAGSSFKPSSTIFGARINPMVGFTLKQGKNRHKLMAGFDLTREFADEFEGRKYLYDIDFYYSYTRKIHKSALSVTAGIFPRKFSAADWSTAFFSDRYTFYNPFMTGLLISYKGRKSNFELGCDWMWKKSQTRREKFMIFSSGQGALTDWFSLGYMAYMLHFASSHTVFGVCDNILAEPYLRFDFAKMAGIQKLSLSAGWLQALQRDRVQVGKFVAPFSGDICLRVQHWGVGVENRTYIGKNLMPLFNDCDSAGNQYGTLLYLGDPFFQSPFYNRLNIYYAPKICRGLDIKAELLFHFGAKGLLGNQQMITVALNLSELIASANKSKASKKNKAAVSKCPAKGESCKDID